MDAIDRAMRETNGFSESAMAHFMVGAPLSGPKPTGTVDRNRRHYLSPCSTSKKLTSASDDFLHDDCELHSICASRSIDKGKLEQLLDENPRFACAIDTNYSRTPLHYLCMNPSLTPEILKIFFRTKDGRLATESPDECGERNPIDYLLENKGKLRISTWQKCVEEFEKANKNSSSSQLDGFLVDTRHRKKRISKLSSIDDDYNFKRPGPIRNGPHAWSPTVRVMCKLPGSLPLRVLGDEREKNVDLTKQHDSSVAPDFDLLERTEEEEVG